MSDEYKANSRYVEAMAAILIPLMVPAQGYDEEADEARDHLVDTGLFSGLEEDEAARILMKHFKAHRTGTAVASDIEAHAKSLPPHLRETVFAKYALYWADASDGTFSDEDLGRFQALEAFLGISPQQARKILEVALIAYSKII